MPGVTLHPETAVTRRGGGKDGKINGNKIPKNHMRKRSSVTVKQGTAMSNKMNQLAGKSMNLKVNPIFERVGDYTRDRERRLFDVRLNLCSLVGIVCAIAQLEACWNTRQYVDDFDPASYTIGEIQSSPDAVIIMGSPIVAEVFRVACTVSTVVLIILRWRMYFYERALNW